MESTAAPPRTRADARAARLHVDADRSDRRMRAIRALILFATAVVGAYLVIAVASLFDAPGARDPIVPQPIGERPAVTVPAPSPTAFADEPTPTPTPMPTPSETPTDASSADPATGGATGGTAPAPAPSPTEAAQEDDPTPDTPGKSAQAPGRLKKPPRDG